jgi:hypothetical protein|tara:strand:- start:477 stop:728 length:252 start_codon:yes stop_codon:yes gene_type:complete
MCGSRNYRKENTMEMNIEQFKFCIQNLCRISKDAILIFDNKVFVNSDAEVSNFKDCKTDEVTGFSIQFALKKGDSDKIIVHTK